MSEDFKTSVTNIGLMLAVNQTMIAHYLAQRLVRDYGTHVTTSVDVGTGLLQVSPGHT